MPDKAPGESRRLPRAWDGAPPLIPHGLDGLVPITRDANACVMCHGSVDAADAGIPPAPASHFLDLRHAPETARETIAGARWVCTSCHVPQTDAAPLVGNNHAATKPAPRQ